MILTKQQMKFLPAIEWLLTDKNHSNKIGNRFLSKDVIKNMKNSGIKFGNRATGRTTLLAYTYVNYLKENPNEIIYPIDIPQANYPYSPINNRYLIECIVNLWNSIGNEEYIIGYSKMDYSVSLKKKS